MSRASEDYPSHAIQGQIRPDPCLGDGGDSRQNETMASMRSNRVAVLLGVCGALSVAAGPGCRGEISDLEGRPGVPGRQNPGAGDTVGIGGAYPGGNPQGGSVTVVAPVALQRATER